jgi:hypothetical protein
VFDKKTLHETQYTDSCEQGHEPTQFSDRLIYIPDDEPVSSKHVEEEVQNGILKLK